MEKSIEILFSELRKITAIGIKRMLTTEEAAIYIGKTANAVPKIGLPHYKAGKCNYYDKNVLDEWMMQNPVAGDITFADKARLYCDNH